MLSEEAARGVRYNLVDVRIHADPACRKGGQLIPAARRAVLAATLTATPRLLEPVFLVTIQVRGTATGDYVYDSHLNNLNYFKNISSLSDYHLDMKS